MTTNRWTQTCWLLGLGLFSAGCAGDEFSSCSSGTCPSGTEGGEAGAGGGAGGSGGATSGDAGDSTASTSSNSAGDSGGSGGGSGSGGSGGSGASGGGSSGGTTHGEAGGGGLGEGGAGANSACEGTCAGSCCDEVCVDLESDPEHCGACDSVCELPDAEAACVAGGCVVSDCGPDHVDCNGDASDGCESELWDGPDPPQLLRPMFGAFTGSLHAREVIGSLRPKFAWAEAWHMTCAKVTYELQVDDTCPLGGFADCAFISPELDVTGLLTTEFVPELELPVEEEQAPVGRRYYWRVRACETSDACSNWSEVFYVDVGRVREDVTGDGYADVVGMAESDPESDPELFVIPGGADFGELNTAEIIPTSETPIHADAKVLSFLGDVDGDGFNDVGGGGEHPNSEGDTSVLYLWDGGTTFGGGRGVIVSSSAAFSLDTVGLWPTGDFDRDGRADMLLRRTVEGNNGQYFFKRGEAVLGNSPGTELLVEPILPAGLSRYPAWHSATHGDFNADGYPDLAFDSELGSVRLLFGRRSLELAPDRTLDLLSAVDRRPTLATLDFNGDDIDDLAVLFRTVGQLVVVFGSSELATEAVPEIWSVELEVAPADLAVGDLDETGFDDLMLSGPMIFEGESEPDTTPEGFVSTVAAEEPIAIADHNGDGTPDLVLANTWYEGVIEPGEHVELSADLDGLDVISLAH